MVLDLGQYFEVKSCGGPSDHGVFSFMEIVSFFVATRHVNFRREISCGRA